MNQSTFFREDNGVLLTSYKVKTTKNVLLMSSRHEYGTVEEGSWKSKPNTVNFYNETKCGVESLDKMCKACSVKSGVRQRSLACFFNILDLAGVNGFILSKKVTGQRLLRGKFLKMFVENSITCARQRQPSLSTF